jgi:hypothetical protein
MATEAGVIPSRSTAAKPARNTEPVTEPKVPGPGEPGYVKPVVKIAPKLDMHRDITRKAKDSHMSMMVDGHKCVNVEYWLPVTHEYKDLLNPVYWGSISHRFMKPISTPGDYAGSIICVRPKDLSWYAELFITEVTTGGVFVEEIRLCKFGTQADAIDSERFNVVWNDSVGGYDIIRKVDGAVLGAAKEFKRLQAVKSWLDKMEG